MPYLTLLLGAIAISFAPILVRFSEMSSSSLVIYRCFIGASLIYIGACIVQKRLLLPEPGSMKYILIGGAFFSADLYLWHESIDIVGAGMATVLANTQVFFAAAYSHLILKEKIPGKFIIWIALALLGLYFLCVQGRSFAIDTEYFYGVSLGLAAGALYSAFLFSMKLWIKNLQPKQSFLPILWISFAAAGFSLISSNFSLEKIQDKELLVILSLGIIVHAGGWILINHSIQKLVFAIVSLGLLLQPVLASILAFILFNESLTVIQITGMALCLIAIYRGGRCLREVPVK